MKYLIPALIIIAVVILMSCGFSGKVALDPASKDFYETARLIITKQEKDIFNHLPDQESRKEFIRNFWEKRDPDPDTEENEFKEEFFRRIDYANLRFREGIPGWKTDRGRIYIYLGPPDKVDQRPFINYPGVKGLIWWGYYEYRLGIEFVDRVGDGSYTLNQHMSAYGNVLQVIEKAKFGQGFVEGKWKFVDFDVRYNREKKEIVISIPVASLEFKEEEGSLKAEFEFEFFIYKKKGLKMDRFTQIKSFERPEDEVLKLEEIIFTFPYDLKPGKYYFDVAMDVKPGLARARKIFEIKI
jgi:GWxTD domain-containing protein